MGQDGCSQWLAETTERITSLEDRPNLTGPRFQFYLCAQTLLPSSVPVLSHPTRVWFRTPLGGPNCVFSFPHYAAYHAGLKLLGNCLCPPLSSPRAGMSNLQPHLKAWYWLNKCLLGEWFYEFFKFMFLILGCSPGCIKWASLGPLLFHVWSPHSISPSVSDVVSWHQGLATSFHSFSTLDTSPPWLHGRLTTPPRCRVLGRTGRPGAAAAVSRGVCSTLARTQIQSAEAWTPNETLISSWNMETSRHVLLPLSLRQPFLSSMFRSCSTGLNSSPQSGGTPQRRILMLSSPPSPVPSPQRPPTPVPRDLLPSKPPEWTQTHILGSTSGKKSS